MDLEKIRAYCLAKSLAYECLPFDEDVLVFKVGKEEEPKAAKMFAAISISRPDFVYLKCEPALALELRERYDEVEGAYHFNKKHWNQVYLHGRVPSSEIGEMIDHSYALVFASLPKRLRI